MRSLGAWAKRELPPAGRGRALSQRGRRPRPSGGGRGALGAHDDGTEELAAIKSRGGVAIVQDPDDALFRWMPDSALEYVEVDHRVPVGEIAPLLARISRESADEEGAHAVPDEVEFETRIAALDPSVVDSGGHRGEVSGYTCLECKGPLFEIREAGLVRYGCRVGHAYSADGVLDGKDEALEEALYTALNTLEERAQLAENLASRSRENAHSHAAARFEEGAREARRRAETIRLVLEGGPTEAADEIT